MAEKEAHTNQSYQLDESKHSNCESSPVTTSQFKPKEKWRILWNLSAISVAFMMHFTAYHGAANLQSSINSDAGLGTASLACVYVGLVLSNAFFAVMLTKWLGCKWMICASFWLYIPYIAAQFYADFGTFIPTALLVGFGGGPLWVAKCTYVSVVSEVYSELSNVSAEVIVVRFFGIFFMVYQTSNVWGNLISSLVLSLGESSSNSTVDIEKICGVNFCHQDTGENANLKRPEDTKIYTLAGIYMGCMVIASLIVAVCVDSLKRYNEESRQGSATGVSGLKLLGATFKLVCTRRQLLIIPISFWLGMEQAFISADFTQAFVSCAWGISKVGYVMICFGVVNATSALVLGSLVKVTGRIPVICLAAVVHLALLITMLLWKPSPDRSYLFFVVAGLWGLGDGVWLAQINAFCGIMFPGEEEAAYGNFRLWESLGYIVTYAYSTSLCTDVKIYILLVILIISVAGYLAVEYFHSKRLKRMKNKK